MHSTYFTLSLLYYYKWWQPVTWRRDYINLLKYCACTPDSTPHTIVLYHHILFFISAEQTDIPTWPVPFPTLCKDTGKCQSNNNQLLEDRVHPSTETVCIWHTSDHVQQVTWTI